MSSPTILLSAQQLERTTPEGKTLLQPCNFTIHSGDQIGLWGASGSGKSVLLRTIALLDWPNQGKLLWRGETIQGAQAVQRYRTQVAYIRQQPALLAGTVSYNLNLPFTLAAYRGQHQNIALIEQMLQRIGRDLRFLNAESSDLSGGEAQLVCLIRVLQLNPQILLLDEPTAALDPDSALAVEELIRGWQQARDDSAYVWITHSQEQLSHIGKTVWQMSNGCLNTEASHA